MQELLCQGYVPFPRSGRLPDWRQNSVDVLGDPSQRARDGRVLRPVVFDRRIEDTKAHERGAPGRKTVPEEGVGARVQPTEHHIYGKLGDVLRPVTPTECGQVDDEYLALWRDQDTVRLEVTMSHADKLSARRIRPRHHTYACFARIGLDHLPDGVWVCDLGGGWVS